jgi:DNA-binding CsgD family transcriptional regulator/catechol 2,3-dioxygenase-like lactoylglutathione lyase family enzyme
MAVTKARGRPPHQDVLTPAEWRVVEAVRHGLGNVEIAALQGVSPDAIKFHVANALLKLGFTTRVELRQWNGVRRDSPLFKKEMDMDRGLALGAVGQIARSVRDVAAARRWYEDVLGLRHLYSFGDLAFFDLDGPRLFLSQGDGAADSILYFRVADVRTAHKTLERQGVEFTHAPHMIHRHEDGAEEWMAFFKDNEGRPLAIMAEVRADPDGSIA